VPAPPSALAPAPAPERSPLLVIAIGNPSRGDDALGPAFLERVEAEHAAAIATGELELLTDFQLQVEHALDLVGRRRVVFVDAAVKLDDPAAPFAFERAEARRDESFSSHALSPAAVLDAMRALGEPIPESWVLAIRGERFELGEGLSDAARAGLEAALAAFAETLGGWRDARARDEG
jgi:hydrogenase maturation protease